MSLPTVIATSVVRSAHQGESHGGVFLVDLERQRIRQVIDWNQTEISFQGRGGDRGLRGIAFRDDLIYVAASDEVLIFDQSFAIVGSIRNRHLKHCHEIHIDSDRLYLTSTGFDSILVFDLAGRRFTDGYCIRYAHGSPEMDPSQQARVTLNADWFHPEADGGPTLADTTHLNSVWAKDGRMWVCGVQLPAVLSVGRNEKGEASIGAWARAPGGTHNARPFRDGVLANHTAGRAVCLLDREGNIRQAMNIIGYDESELLNNDLPEDFARQQFGRGLCVCDENHVIAGSSPSTISVYDLSTGRRIKTVNLTMDVRNAIHGLEVYPYPVVWEV